MRAEQRSNGSGTGQQEERGAFSPEVDGVHAPVLLTPGEAAAWCHITVGTLNHLRYHGRFAPAVRIGKRCFWMPKDLLAWLEEQKEPA
jgi:hypothetical protein